jgi:hypothetical protein
MRAEGEREIYHPSLRGGGEKGGLRSLRAGKRRSPSFTQKEAKAEHLSDHGQWSKHSNYKQATHAPQLIVAPDRTTEKRSPVLVEFTDIYRTIC